MYFKVGDQYVRFGNEVAVSFPARNGVALRYADGTEYGYRGTELEVSLIKQYLQESYTGLVEYYGPNQPPEFAYDTGTKQVMEQTVMDFSVVDAPPIDVTVDTRTPQYIRYSLNPIQHRIDHDLLTSCGIAFYGGNMVNVSPDPFDTHFCVKCFPEKKIVLF